MPSLQGALTKPEEMRDFHKEKAINAWMLQGGRGEGSGGRERGKSKDSYKVHKIPPPPKKNGSLVPKIDQRRKKAPQMNNTEVGITERERERTFWGRRCEGPGISARRLLVSGGDLPVTIVSTPTPSPPNRLEAMRRASPPTGRKGVNFLPN